ncbi:effector-associated constant component EACC1 [Nocardia beijingensis]|uniref:effector-associated constant component EACC1 n=1 Tax=Nocardia beijingensis TaxID=95162 RepID=UPI0033B6E2C2
MTSHLAHLRVVVGDYDDLLSLRSWLRDEDALRGRVDLLHAAAAPDRMGSLSDALVIALGAGGALTVLARAIPDWLLRHKNVTIEIAGPQGRSVTISATGVRDPRALIREVLARNGNEVTGHGLPDADQ